jgi:O-antigen/teichoic acid export membrane protein
LSDPAPETSGSTSGLARTVARNTAWSAFAAVASPLLMFLFGGLTIRYVGLEAAGISVVTASIFGVAARLTLLGVSEAFIPRMAAAIAANDQHETKTLFGTVVAFSTAMAAATAILVTGCWFLVVDRSPATALPKDTGAFLVVASLTHVVTTVQNVFAGVLRSAQRFDLLSAFTVPISFLTGLCGCLILPAFPRLTTVAAVGFLGAVASLAAAAFLARRTAPDIARPLLAVKTLVPLIRYGAWITLANLLSVLTASVDSLVLAAFCGTAAVAPYNIGKQLFVTGHTMLLQQTEHIGPTLSALGDAQRDTADRIAGGMLWLTALLAAVGYTFIAWAGPVLVDAIAGDAVAHLSRVAIQSYAAYGLVMSLLIVPVTIGMASGFPKLTFLVGLAVGPSLLVGIAMLGYFDGVPAVYLAPMLAIPGLFLLLGTTPHDLCDTGVLSSRLAVIAAPLALAIVAIGTSAMMNLGSNHPARLATAAVIGVGMIPAVLGLEHVLQRNRDLHATAWRLLRATAQRFQYRRFPSC